MARQDDVKKRLVDSLWGADGAYYDAARTHVLEAASAGREYDWVRSHLPAAGKVLEVGCGEGTNMEVLARDGIEWYGCDLSTLAVERAAAKRPGGCAPAVAVADVERLPFVPGFFDAVVAISILEHLPDPEAMLESAIEALVPGGRLLIVSPQYGGPLGASPCRKGGGAARFVARLLAAHAPGGDGRRLRWERVRPAVLDGAAYDGDMDTVVEPELRSLERFLRRRGLRVRASTSGLEWHSWRQGRMSLGQRIARGIFEPVGRLGLPPYRRFGPLVVVCAERPIHGPPARDPPGSPGVRRF
jgi:SAM-dependent methyltransferase